MSAALSLLDDESYDDRRSAASSSLSRDATPAPAASQRTPMDPDVVRDRERISLALKPGGISVALLIFSTVIASPAIFQCVVRQAISVTTMMERWVVITVGCWIITELVRRLLPRFLAAQAAKNADESADQTDAGTQSAAEKKAQEFGMDPLDGYDAGLDDTWRDLP